MRREYAGRHDLNAKDTIRGRSGETIGDYARDTVDGRVESAVALRVEQ